MTNAQKTTFTSYFNVSMCNEASFLINYYIPFFLQNVPLYKYDNAFRDFSSVPNNDYRKIALIGNFILICYNLIFYSIYQS